MVRQLSLRATCLGVLAFGAFALPAPAIAAPQVRTSATFAEPMQEAVALIKNRKYAQALSKVDKAAPLAKSAAERLSVEQLRTAIYNGLGQRANLIRSLEAQLSIGGLPTKSVKAHKLTLAGLYSKQKNDAKAIEITRSYIKDYGGTPDQLAFVASYDLNRKRYADAVSYGTKAIAQAKAGGVRVEDAWRKIVMRAEFERGNLDGYYGAVEQAAADSQKGEYFRILAERAAHSQGFNRARSQLDIYRAMATANVVLTPAEQADWAERAFIRGVPEEAASVLTKLAASQYAGIDASKVDRLKRMRTESSEQTKKSIDRRVSEGRATGPDLVVAGEAYSQAGRQREAIATLRKALARGDLRSDQIDFARLQLGIAQLRAGEPDVARQSWAAIKSETPAGTLARAWRLIAQSKSA